MFENFDGSLMVFNHPFDIIIVKFFGAFLVEFLQIFLIFPAESCGKHNSFRLGQRSKLFVGPSMILHHLVSKVLHFLVNSATGGYFTKLYFEEASLGGLNRKVGLIKRLSSVYPQVGHRSEGCSVFNFIRVAGCRDAVLTCVRIVATVKGGYKKARCEKCKWSFHV